MSRFDYVDDRDPEWGWWKSPEVFEEAAKLHHMGMPLDKVLARLKDLRFVMTLAPTTFETAVHVCMDTAPGYTDLLDRRTFSVAWAACTRAALRRS